MSASRQQQRPRVRAAMSVGAKQNAAIQRTPALTRSNDRRGCYFMPESCLFFIYIALSAALGWPIIIGPAVGALAAAAGGAFGFAACFLAKTGEVDTARIARPTTMIFFMLNSLKKTHGSQSQTLDRGQEP